MDDGYVLIVDDQPDVRRLIMDVLVTLKVQCREAINGVQALDMVRESLPRVIVLDIMMPVMNGLTLLTHLQSEKFSRQVPIILLSGVADDGPQMRNLPGVVGVLKKGGFSINELRGMLSAALKDTEPVS